MMRYKLPKVFFVVCVLYFSVATPLQAAAKLTVADMVRAILQNYPSVKIAQLEVTQAAQETAKIRSQLGWIFTTQFGISHDLSFVDQPTDEFNVNGVLHKELESGSSLEFSAEHRYSEAKNSFSPISPNPSQRTGIDVRYRKPLLQDADNADYKLSYQSAEISGLMQQMQKVETIDQLLRQAIDIYYSAALLHAQIDDAQKALQRARRLKKFVEKNMSIGLAERLDLLQVQAQLDAQQARADELQSLWIRQQFNLNHLMGKNTDFGFVPDVSNAYAEVTAVDEIHSSAISHNPQLKILTAQQKLAEAEVLAAQDSKKDKLDLILSLGGRSSSGDVVAGDFKEEELVGSAQIEYRYAFDKKGFDAGLYQARLRQQILDEEYQRVKSKLYYDTQALIDQMKTNQKAYQSNYAYLQTEREKMQEAVARYREGRATTNDLVQFENSLQQASFATERQAIETARTFVELQLLQGDLWHEGMLDNK